MRVCYLVLAHTGPDHFRRLMAALADEDASVIVHVDRKVPVQDFADAAAAHGSVRLLNERRRVAWSTWGVVAATLDLMRAGLAEATEADYYALLSGDSYPLRSQREVTEFLAGHDGTEFMDILPLPSPKTPAKSLTRLTRYHHPHDPRTHPAAPLFAIASRVVPSGYRRGMGGLTPYAGGTWWTLTRRAVQFLVSESERRRAFVQFCQHTSVPDEHFFQTLLANSALFPSVRPANMFADFMGRASPVNLDESYIPDWLEHHRTRDSPYGRRDLLFARKVPDDAETLVKRIQSEIWDMGT